MPILLVGSEMTHHGTSEAKKNAGVNNLKLQQNLAHTLIIFQKMAGF